MVKKPRRMIDYQSWRPEKTPTVITILKKPWRCLFATRRLSSSRSRGPIVSVQNKNNSSKNSDGIQGNGSRALKPLFSSYQRRSRKIFFSYPRPSRKRSASNLGRDLGQFQPLKETIDCEF